MWLALYLDLAPPVHVLSICGAELLCYVFRTLGEEDHLRMITSCLIHRSLRVGTVGGLMHQSIYVAQI